MNSKFILLFLLIAVSKAQAEECASEDLLARAQECTAGILELLTNEPSVAEACQVVRTAKNCLRRLADDCLDEEDTASMDEAIHQLDALTEKCPKTDTNDVNDDANEVCVEDNKDYVLGCLRENQMRAISHFTMQRNPDENDIKCTVYNWIGDCVIERVVEKCGAEAGEEMREELNDPPIEIKEACLALNRPVQL